MSRCDGCDRHVPLQTVMVGTRTTGLCLDCLRGLRAEVHRAIDHALALRRTGEFAAMPDDDSSEGQ